MELTADVITLETSATFSMVEQLRDIGSFFCFGHNFSNDAKLVENI